MFVLTKLSWAYAGHTPVHFLLIEWTGSTTISRIAQCAIKNFFARDVEIELTQPPFSISNYSRVIRYFIQYPSDVLGCRPSRPQNVFYVRAAKCRCYFAYYILCNNTTFYTRLNMKVNLSQSEASRFYGLESCVNNSYVRLVA